MPSKKNEGPGLLWPVLFTIGLFAAAEGGLRLAGFEYSNAPIGLRYAASIAHVGHDRSEGDRTFHIAYQLDPVLLWRPTPQAGVTNSLGFLGPDWSGEKKPGVSRVATLGDSCTIAGKPPYPEELQKKLGPRFEVLNAGVGSWSSYQGLQLLRTRLLAYHPDAVTIYFGWNDHWLAWAAPDKELSRLLDRQWRAGNLVNKSKVLQALLKLIAKARGGPRFGPETPYRVSLDDYEGNLRRMAGLIKASGAKAVFVTAPSGLTPEHPVTKQLCEDTHNFYDPALIGSVHAAYNERVRRAAAETGSTLVDLERDFAAAKEPGALFTDGIHLSAAGHERAAARLAAALRAAR